MPELGNDGKSGSFVVCMQACYQHFASIQIVQRAV